MNQEIIHVYLMPGMAASDKIFEHISLPEDRFQLHYLNWIPPQSLDESLVHYAERMSKLVKHTNIVLIGVSFGGILVQEMKAFVKPIKTIIVSSVKTNKELPRRMLLAKRTKIYKVLPTQLASNVDLLAKYAFGKTITRRLELYKKYLAVNDKLYLDWAIKNVIHWNRETPDDEIVHIHGESDQVFPVKYIPEYIPIKNATHIMIINKYKWFNEKLPQLIDS
ncbi:MAG: alpha/beta hydrolase [bacterium]